MMAAKPLVCSITAPPTWAEKCNCGIVVESEDVDAVVDSIRTIMKMSDAERTSMGNNGVEYAREFFNIKNLAEKVISVIDVI